MRKSRLNQHFVSSFRSNFLSTKNYKHKQQAKEKFRKHFQARKPLVKRWCNCYLGGTTMLVTVVVVRVASTKGLHSRLFAFCHNVVTDLFEGFEGLTSHSHLSAENWGFWEGNVKSKLQTTFVFSRYVRTYQNSVIAVFPLLIRNFFEIIWHSICYLNEFFAYSAPSLFAYQRIK